MRRPMIVGESLPFPGAQPLSAVKAGSTGWRLWRVAAYRTFLTADEYHEVFDRRNLCGAEWSWDVAKEAAIFVSANSQPGQVVVLLGEKVRRAFAIPVGVNPYVASGVEYYAIPHPSGLNRWYNDPVNRNVVGDLLASIYSRYRAEESASDRRPEGTDRQAPADARRLPRRRPDQRGSAPGRRR